MSALPATPWYLRKPIPITAAKTTEAMLDRVERLWRIRPCFVCDKRGCCYHREYEVDAAWLSVGDERSVSLRSAGREPSPTR